MVNNLFTVAPVLEKIERRSVFVLRPFSAEKCPRCSWIVYTNAFQELQENSWILQKSLHRSINYQYLGAAKEAKSFMEVNPISLSLQIGFNKTVEKNREIISSIISNVIFCGTHDTPLRGKEQNESDLCDKIIILCVVVYNLCVIVYFQVYSEI